MRGFIVKLVDGLHAACTFDTDLHDTVQERFVPCPAGTMVQPFTNVL